MGTVPSGTAGSSFSSQPILGFEVLDSSGKQITGAFKNAVTVSSNNNAVQLCQLGNCGSATTSVTLTSGTSQILAMNYSGAAVNTVTITATATGAITGTTTFTPPIPSLVYSGPTNSSTGAPEIDLYAPTGTGSTYSFTVTQAGYTGSPYNNSILGSAASGCSAFATVTQPTSTTFTVTATASPAAGSCMLTLSGFNGSTPITVTLTYSSFGVTLQ